MSGLLLTSEATIQCPHGGQVTMAGAQPRVRASGSPVIPQPGLGMVQGCPFEPFGGSGPTGKMHTITGPLPCLSVDWRTATTRVRSQGEPLLLDTSQGVLSPGGGAAAVVSPGQVRVRAI
jgi:hypothetical protein